MKFRILLTLAAVSIAFMLQACTATEDPAGSGPVDGVYLLLKVSYMQDDGGDLYQDSSVYDTSDVYAKRFVIIGRETILQTAFQLSGDFMETQNTAYFDRFVSVGGNRFLLGRSDTVKAIKRGNQLIVTSSGENEYGAWSDTTTMVSYSGKFPPDEWYGPAENILEPDNTRLTAKPINVTGMTQYRYLTEDDVDWFSFTAEEGVEYSIPTSGLETQIDVYSPTVLKLDTDYDDLYWTSPASGTYYFRVRAYDSEDTGPYGASIYPYDDYMYYKSGKSPSHESKNSLLQRIPLKTFPERP